MAKIIKGILPRDEIKKITTGLFSAQFLDGGMSGGQLGKKLKNNNVKVEIKVYKGLMHGFLTMGGTIKEVSSVLAFINKKIDNYL